MADQQGVVSWWDLAETTGTVALAYGPSLNHGQYVGNPTKNGAAGVVMNGTSQYVTVPDDASLDLTTATIWCQVQRGATGAIRTLMSKGGASAWQLRLDATGKPQLVVAGTVVLTAAAALDTAVHTITACIAPGQALLCVDGGTPVQTASGVPAVGVNALPLTLGVDTLAGGTRQQYYNGTILGAAILSTWQQGNPSYSPLILVQLGGLNWLGVPTLLAAYRDPADSTTPLATQPIAVQVVTATLPLISPAKARWRFAGGAWTDLILTAGAGTIPSQAWNPNLNGTAQQLTVQVVDNALNPYTTWDVAVRVRVALARLAPNPTLGANVISLADTWAMLPSLPSGVDDGAVFYRAMAGPGPTDYAPGSAWAATAAAVQGQLPAQGAYLAAQVQLVRRT
jgi:hypothetical protein